MLRVLFTGTSFNFNPRPRSKLILTSCGSDLVCLSRDLDDGQKEGELNGHLRARANDVIRHCATVTILFLQVMKSNFSLAIHTHAADSTCKCSYKVRSPLPSSIIIYIYHWKPQTQDYITLSASSPSATCLPREL